MAEEKPVVTNPVIPVVAKQESKPAGTPVAPVAKAPVVAKPVVDDKSKPVESKVEDKPIEEKKPSEELKTLLDEASEEEVKLDEDGNPIKEAKTSQVPEKYEFKLPEGITLNEAAMAIVDPIFKELGLSNEQAQKLVDVQLELNKQNEDGQVNAFNKYVEDLKVESKTFFGPKLPEVMRNVARARDQFIHKELQEKLNISGLSNDKDVLVMLDKLGRVVGEGKFIDGKRSAPAAGKVGVETPTGKDASLAEVYPSMVQK